MINELADLMEPGDIIVDGGNAFYQDTIRREKEMSYELSSVPFHSWNTSPIWSGLMPRPRRMRS